MPYPHLPALFSSRTTSTSANAATARVISSTRAEAAREKSRAFPRISVTRAQRPLNGVSPLSAIERRFRFNKSGLGEVQNFAFGPGTTRSHSASFSTSTGSWAIWNRFSKESTESVRKSLTSRRRQEDSALENTEKQEQQDGKMSSKWKASSTLWQKRIVLGGGLWFLRSL